jgi:hypothetical protein
MAILAFMAILAISWLNAECFLAECFSTSNLAGDNAIKTPSCHAG